MVCKVGASDLRGVVARTGWDCENMGYMDQDLCEFQHLCGRDGAGVVVNHGGQMFLPLGFRLAPQV